MKKTGDEYFDSEEFRELLAEYEEAVGSGQPVFMDAEELTEIADYYHCTGANDQANDAIHLAISLSPDAVAPLDYLFHEALADRNPAQAEELLDRMIDKTGPEYIYDRAELMLYHGKANNANAYLRKEQKKVPEEEMQDYVVDVATLFSDYDQPTIAMEWLNEGNEEDTPEYQELKAHMLAGIGRYKDSLKIFNELIDRNPFSKRYWNGMANTQLMEEDYDKAVESSEFAIAIDPNDPEGLLAKADALFHLNNFTDALEYYGRYNQLEPDDAYGLLYQGICLLNLDRIEEAVVTLEKAEAVDEGMLREDIIEELAFAYNELGATPKALELLDSLDSDDPNTHSNVLIMKGHLLLCVGRNAEAESLFSEAINTHKAPHEAILRVIISLFDNQFIEGAYKMFKRLYKLAPSDFNYGYAYMALCCYDLKYDDEFLFYLKEACQRNPRECRSVLSFLFPSDVKPQDYYNYYVKEIKGEP
ncbi:MAG: tetratricopeptide repeat protein [Prevotella sp.]|nr:tetratricopeptide repeat protein [Prevotella sp.]